MRIKDETAIQNALYNCKPAAGQKELNTQDHAYARGILVGLVSGLQAKGEKFTDIIYELVRLVRATKTDLTLMDVYYCLPFGWDTAWDEALECVKHENGVAA